MYFTCVIQYLKHHLNINIMNNNICEYMFEKQLRNLHCKLFIKQNPLYQYIGITLSKYPRLSIIITSKTNLQLTIIVMQNSKLMEDLHLAKKAY